MDVNNQGLNLPSNLQNLDVRNELLSKEVGSGASCAYSLRDLTGSNKKAVRVRRTPNDTTNSIDDETIFGGQEVQAGYLEDWVNGKLEHTLPCDVATASAGYSLRKIKSSYSGNAVRIRRDSDSIEVNVAFDSDDKVSASSPVTATPSGSTTATDLNGFLNESTENFTAIAYDDIAAIFKQFSSTPTISNTAIAGSTGTVDANGARLGFKLPSQLSISDYSGLKIKVTGTINSFTADSSLVIGAAKVDNGGSSFTPPEGGKAIASGTTGDFEYIFTGDTTNTFQSVIFIFADNSTFDISNLKFEIIEHGATVQTWYDQAGSNNAVQTTASNQPKIAESGALLADGITFDGSDDFLQTSTQVLTNTYTGARSLYGVCKINTDSGYIFGDAGSGTDEGTSFYSDTSSDKILFTNGKSGTLTTFDNITTIEGSNFLISSNYNNNNATTIHKNANNNGYTQGTGSYNFSTSSKFTIGDREGGSSSATKLNGTIQEIIAYNSDQSAKRFKIESNINNYYGLYNDANAFSANAQVDGTGSTVSNASKDGGTLTLSSASGNNYLYFQLTETVPATSGDIFISFNYESSNDSVTLNNVKLRNDADSAMSGDLVDSSGSAITIQENGFYSGKLASANLTNTGTRLAFLTNQTTNGYTFTISNLRYSRIARDGFVETLYDQSGNSRDASQGTAGSQPFIVRNGGQVKLQNQPSIDFDGRGSSSATGLVTNYDISSDGSLTEYSIYGVFDNTANTPHSTLISAGQPISNSTSYGGFNVFVNQNGGRLEIEHQEHPNTSKTTVRPTNSYTTGDGYKILTINYNSSSLLSKLVNVTSGSSAENTSPALPKARDDIAVAQYLKIGGSYTFQYRDAWQGFISEVIIFEDDIRSDNDDIVDNLTDFYGQPSSTP